MSLDPQAEGGADEGALQTGSQSGLTCDELFVLARADFWVFVELMFEVLHPGERLVFAPYLELIATLLMSVAEGRKRRVIINLPPRHMKSMLVSVLYVAWRLGLQSERQIHLHFLRR